MARSVQSPAVQGAAGLCVGVKGGRVMAAGDTAAPRSFVPAPPFPAVYGPAAAMSLGLGVFGGFAVGLYALGAPDFGWPVGRYAALVQVHGQVQVLGFAGLLILGVGSLLLPAFWRARLANPGAVARGGGLVGLGLIAQLIGQPLNAGSVRWALLLMGALLPIVGFVWAGSGLVRLRAGQHRRPAAWETLLVLAACSLVGALLLRSVLLVDLAATGLPASYGLLHQALIPLELEGFLLTATLGVQLRLVPSLARTRPVTGWPERVGIAALAVAILCRLLGVGLAVPALADAGDWLVVAALLALFWATGLGRAGLAPTVQAP